MSACSVAGLPVLYRVVPSGSAPGPCTRPFGLERRASSPGPSSWRPILPVSYLGEPPSAMQASRRCMGIQVSSKDSAHELGERKVLPGC